MNELILASKSPRRKELMKLLGHPFSCISSDIEEVSIEGETPAKHVRRLSEMKALSVGNKIKHGIIIGSDTIVVIDKMILEKPDSEQNAVEMLMRLQGRTHKVYTGFSLYNPENGKQITAHEITDVTMRSMNENMIKKYLETGEPFDKAGAYGIQGYGAVLIESIKGCYFNVMGLPLSKLMGKLYSFSEGKYGYFGKTEMN